MADPTPTPQATPGTADGAFVARTSYQSDASYAAAYLAAHPEEAKNFGVNLPTPQATPTYVPGTATAGGQPNEAMAPDLSIMQPKPPPGAGQGPAAQNPFDSAVATAKATYPRIASVPMKLTTGSGPGMSETFEPNDNSNPARGNWTVQLRDQSVVNDKSMWPDYVGLEALHPLYANDKGYQNLTDQFVKSMTPEQTADAQRTYQDQKKIWPTDESFDKWLPRVQAQEYIRGMIFPKAAPGWMGADGEGKYTPEQLQLGHEISQYLRTPDTKQLPPGVATAAQEALQAPAIDPTMVIGGGVAGGLEGGIAAGVKAGAQSALSMEVQDAASRVTGLATNNPYLKGLVGLVAPIALSILAKRGISAVGGAAAEPPELPQGTVLDASGQPVTSAPTAPEAQPAQGAAPAPEQPGATLGTRADVEPINLSPQEESEFVNETLAKAPTGQPGLSVVKDPNGLDAYHVVYRGPDGQPVSVAVVRHESRDTSSPLGTVSFATDKSKGLLASRASVAVGQQLQDLGAARPTAGGQMTPDSMALLEHAQAGVATPQAAAQTLADKQLEALKTARVGESVATEFGKPEIATTIPEKQTIAEGQALRQTVEMPTPPGAAQPQLAAHTAAVAGVYQDEAKAIRDEATRITAAQEAGGDMSADKAALANRFSAYAINYANLAGMRSEMGRGLQILDPLKPGNVLAAETAKLAQSLNPDDVDTLVERLSRLEPEQQAAMARQVGEAAQQGRSVSGMLREYYYNALLSKPTTVIKKVAGDLTSWALNAPTRAIAARIPSWGTAPALARGEGNEFAYGSATALGDGLRVARNTWNLGASAIDAIGGGRGGEFEAPMPPEIRGSGKGGIMDTGADLLGDVVRLPTRTIGAVHEFSRFVNFRGELRALALRQATSEAGVQGLAGEEAGNFIAQRTEELADNPPPELTEAAHSAANYNVFSQPLGPAGQAFNDWLDKLPAGLGRIAFPFRRVPVNLAKWALSYTPIPAIAGAPGAAANVVGRALGYDGQALGNTLNSFYSDIQAGGAQGQMALAKLGMGSAAMLMVARHTMDGYITGGGPSDPKQYHDLIATGWKPYAIHVGDHYLTFQNLEPLAMPLGIAADYATIMGNSPQADVEHGAVASAMALGRNLSRQSYVEMLANFNDMIDGLRTGKDTGEAIDKFVENQLSGIIPAAIRAEAKREDPVMRDTRGMFNTFLSKIPGYSKTLPPMTDALARPIMTPPGFLANEVYPFQIGTDAHDPIAAETLRIDASPQKAPSLLPGSGTKSPSLMTSPTDPNVGIPLTEWDKNQWMNLRASIKDDEGPDGKTLEQTLNALRQDPDYQALAREDQAKQWEDVFVRYGHAATNQMIANRPDLRQKLELRQQYKALGHLPPGTDANTFLRSNGITPISAGGSL
jgi:hypothetical protein